MSISVAVQNSILREAVHYDVVRHSWSNSSSHTAQLAHVPGDRLAKPVLLEDEAGFVMAVIPATHRVDLGVVGRMMKRKLGLASESELGDIFPDCEVGAIPPIGPAYGIATVVDEKLLASDDVYFEAGDHCDVLHVSGDDFRKLMSGARVGRFSHHA
jgi:Ala-tRNA(Pro) deacylase